MNDSSEDVELAAMSQVFQLLRDLDQNAQKRILAYIAKRLDLLPHQVESEMPTQTMRDNEMPSAGKAPDESIDPDDLSGISSVAQKWMRRNGLSADELSKLFSLGIDDIDLVAKSVPGKSMAERTKSVLLLLGVSSYLSSGAPRVPDDRLREALVHYDAYDSANFAKHLRTNAALASGTKESGYTLTARGLTSATEVIREMLAGK